MKRYFPGLSAFSKAKSFIHSLQPHLAVLKNIAGSTEKEFLLVGEKLQEFHQTAQDISQAATQVAEKISGQEVANIREELIRIPGLIAHMSQGMTSEKENVHHILSSFRALKQPLLEFENVVRNLDVLCNFINIEIARLGRTDTSFSKLSEDVRALARLIGLKINALIDQTDAAIPSLNQNVLSIEKCDILQKDQEQLILEKINNDLAMLAQANEASAKTVLAIPEAWRTISNHIGEVVQSLQFHDITRQRIEHVCHSLEQLPKKIHHLRKEKRKRLIHWIEKHRNGARSESSREVDPSELIAATFDLQAAQLQGADGDLMEAVARILDNLRRIARDASAISQDLSLLSCRRDSGEGSFLTELEQDIHQLCHLAQGVATLKKDLASAMDELSQTALGMSVFTKDMEKISIEMQRLALNARIHAAHIGDQGATLEVLSDAINQLSLDTAVKVSCITKHLQAVVENAAMLARLAGAKGDTGSGGMIGLQENFGKMIKPLHGIEEQIDALLPRIDQTGVMLAGDIEHLIDRIRVHIHVSRDIAQVNHYLLATAGEIKNGQTKRAVHQKAGALLDLSASYTMHRERETHSAASGATPPATGAGQAAILAAISISASDARAIHQEDDLGDNVELF